MRRTDTKHTEIELSLIKFAFKKGDKLQYFALNEQKYDDWAMGDSGQEAYHIFEYVGNVKVNLEYKIEDGEVVFCL